MHYVMKFQSLNNGQILYAPMPYFLKLGHILRVFSEWAKLQRIVRVTHDCIHYLFQNLDLYFI